MCIRAKKRTENRDGKYDKQLENESQLGGMLSCKTLLPKKKKEVEREKAGRNTGKDLRGRINARIYVCGYTGMWKAGLAKRYRDGPHKEIGDWGSGQEELGAHDRLWRWMDRQALEMDRQEGGKSVDPPPSRRTRIHHWAVLAKKSTTQKRSMAANIEVTFQIQDCPTIHLC